MRSVPLLTQRPGKEVLELQLAPTLTLDPSLKLRV